MEAMGRFVWFPEDVGLMEEKHYKGGAGSGNFNHSGRPGLVGGSSPGGGHGGSSPKPPSYRFVMEDVEEFEFGEPKEENE